MRKLKELSRKAVAMGIINSLTLMVIIQSANTACGWVFHQPIVPDAVNKFKRH